MVNYRYSTLGIFDAMGISFGVPAVPQYQDVAFKVDLPTKGKLGRFQLFGMIQFYIVELLSLDWSNPSNTDFDHITSYHLRSESLEYRRLRHTSWFHSFLRSPT